MERSGYSSDHINIQLTRDVKIPLHLFQRVHIPGNQRSIEFIINLGSSFKVDGHIYSSARQACTDATFDSGFD